MLSDTLGLWHPWTAVRALEQRTESVAKLKLHVS